MVQEKRRTAGALTGAQHSLSYTRTAFQPTHYISINYCKNDIIRMPLQRIRINTIMPNVALINQTPFELDR